jgi:MFS transporter, TsgA protein
MTRARFPATVVAVATYVIVAGIFTQSGVVLQPAAAYFHASVPDTAVLFSYVSAGNVAGILLSLGAFNVFSIRQVLIGAYACMFAGVATIVATHQLPVACIAIFAIGLGVGTGLSAGAVILAKLYTDRARAVAVLSTDCAFRATGFVIPAVAAAVISLGWTWQSGYEMVALIAAATLIAVCFIAFPATGRSAAAKATRAEPAPRRAYATIALFAIGIALYLTGQTTFTIWAPTVLQNLLGVPALQAGTIVSSFFGPSSLGLVTAAVLVSRVPPRLVLIFALAMGSVLTLTLALLTDAHTFFLVTFAFGFTTTCMFKLMISIGSEQLPNSPPWLVTFLLFCSGLGTTTAPIVSAQLVKLSGIHASLWVAFAFYVATAVTIGAALATEGVAGLRSQPAAATGS